MNTLASLYPHIADSVEQEKKEEREFELEKIKALSEAMDKPSPAVNPFVSVVNTDKVNQQGVINNITLTDQQFTQLLEVIKSK